MARTGPAPKPAPCPPKPSLRERPLIAPDQATELTALFKVLASGTRLRILHALVRVEEMCVSDLAQAIQMKPQAVSNQLQRLVAQGLLGSRRNGNEIRYRIVDPCISVLLEQGWCLAEDAERRRTP